MLVFNTVALIAINLIVYWSERLVGEFGSNINIYWTDRLTFSSTDSESFSRFMILMATFWLVTQWTPSLTSPLIGRVCGWWNFLFNHHNRTIKVKVVKVPYKVKAGARDALVYHNWRWCSGFKVCRGGCCWKFWESDGGGWLRKRKKNWN